MPHITFEEYAAMGYSKVSQAAFPRFALLATKEIDYRTLNRIKDVADDIRLVACEVVDIIYADSGQTVTSVSTDGYSESYADPMSTDEQITAICLKYLPQSLTSWVVSKDDVANVS